jgi:hypothetical protein
MALSILPQALIRSLCVPSQISSIRITVWELAINGYGVRGNYDGSLRRGSAGLKLLLKQSARSNANSKQHQLEPNTEEQSARSVHPNVSDGNATQ